MHKSATKCNETVGKWCINKHGASKIMDTLETYHLTPQLEKEEEDFVQETPEAALIVAQAYLLTTRLEPGDPQEDMHQAAIRSLGIVENKIRGKGPEVKTTSYKEKQKWNTSTIPRERSLVSHQKKKGDKGGRTQEI
jgi:hypothetical protein